MDRFRLAVDYLSRVAAVEMLEDILETVEKSKNHESMTRIWQFDNPTPTATRDRIEIIE